MTTICADCTNYLDEGPIWYEQYCGAKAVRRRQVQNVVTGKMGYQHSDRKEPHCRDINRGKCPHFEAQASILQLIPFLKLGE